MSRFSPPPPQIPGYVTLLNQLLAFTPPDHVERLKFEEARAKLQELSVVRFVEDNYLRLNINLDFKFE